MKRRMIFIAVCVALCLVFFSCGTTPRSTIGHAAPSVSISLLDVNPERSELNVLPWFCTLEEAESALGLLPNQYSLHYATWDERKRGENFVAWIIMDVQVYLKELEQNAVMTLTFMVGDEDLQAINEGGETALVTVCFNSVLSGDKEVAAYDSKRQELLQKLSETYPEPYALLEQTNIVAKAFEVGEQEYVANLMADGSDPGFAMIRKNCAVIQFNLQIAGTGQTSWTKGKRTTLQP